MPHTVNAIAGPVSFLVVLSAYFVLISAILRNRKEQKHGDLPLVAYAIWGMINLIIWAAMLSEGDFSFQIACYVLGNAIVCGIALKYGSFSWSRNDTIILLLAILAMVLWFFAGPVLAIFISMVAYFLGSLPLWKAMYDFPGSQGRAPWVLFLLGGTCGLFAVPEWTLVSATAPIGIFLLQVGTLVAIFLGDQKRAPA